MQNKNYKLVIKSFKIFSNSFALISTQMQMQISTFYNFPHPVKIFFKNTESFPSRENIDTLIYV